MGFLKRPLIVTLCLVALIFLNIGRTRAAHLVWFCPNDSRLLNTSDDAQWPHVRSHVQVYKFYYQVIRDSPVAELQAKFQWLKAHHIALAVEWPAMTWTDNGPGFNVEGFNPAGTSEALARKIQSAGGTLDYAAMDEPLYYGHFDSGPHSTHWPVATIAANVAADMRQVWAIFPRCRVGDIEPIDAMPVRDALPTTAQWIDAFQTASGHRLAFLHDDILWDSGWRQSIPKLVPLLAAKHLDFGVIFNATGGPGPDARWMESAEVNIRSYNASRVPKPDHVIFQTWYPYPKAILPETVPTSFSSLVSYFYSRQASQPPPVPLRRFYSASLGRHRYTADAKEAAALQAQGWTPEPPVGHIYPRPTGDAGLIPLYRLSGGDNDEVLTTDEQERAGLRASGYRDNGIAGYVFPVTNPAGQPLLHAASPTFQNFYTCNPDEYAGLTAPTWQRYGPICAMP